MTATVDNYEVVGSAKIGGAPMVLRRFGTEDEAITHCLGVKMDYWHDVWVRKVQITPKREVLGPPKFPWTVLWQGSYAYIVDADGNKLASLLGPQKQREYVAAIVCDLQGAA